MLSLLVRILLLVAALVTSWVVAKDAVNYSTIQMTVAVLLFVALVSVAAFWPTGWIRKLAGAASALTRPRR